jgi:hypothetical protein
MSTASSCALSTLQTSATSRPKSQPIQIEGAILDIHDIGSLSDYDEIQGAEREAALKSPQNGIWVTSLVIVKVKDLP